MKKKSAAILVLTGLFILNMNIFAGPITGIAYENSIQVASKKDKNDKVKQGKASRKAGENGKASRKTGKNGKIGRG